jgi:hypothetical protein
MRDVETEGHRGVRPGAGIVALARIFQHRWLPARLPCLAHEIHDQRIPSRRRRFPTRDGDTDQSRVASGCEVALCCCGSAHHMGLILEAVPLQQLGSWVVSEGGVAASAAAFADAAPALPKAAEVVAGCERLKRPRTTLGCAAAAAALAHTRRSLPPYTISSTPCAGASCKVVRLEVARC